MRLSSFVCLIFLLLIATESVFAQPEPFGISINEKSPDSTNLSAFAGYFCDTTGKATVHQVFALDALYFQKTPGTLHWAHGEEDINHWVRFQITNTSSDSLNLYLCFSDVADIMRMYRLRFIKDSFPNEAHFFASGASFDSLTAGRLIPYHRLPLLRNQFAIPIQLSAGETGYFICQLRHFWKVNASLSLYTENGERKASEKHRSRNTAKLHFFIAFFAVLGFLLVFAILQYLSLRNRAFLFYAGYLVFIMLYYLRNFQTTGLLHVHFWYPDFRPFFYHLEVPLGYASYVFYILFAGNFLYLPVKDRYLLELLKRFSLLFAALIPVHFIIIEIGGISWNAFIYKWTRMPFFVTSFMFMLIVLWKSRSLLNMLIFTGTFILLLGALMTLSDEVFGGSIQKLPHGIWGWYVNENGRPLFPIYDFKVGVLLEVLCFSTALTLKARRLKQEHQEALLSLGHMHEEREQLMGKLASMANGHALNGAPMESRAISEEHEFLKNARHHLEAHLDQEDFSTDDLAKAMLVSRDQLYRKMKLHAQVTPYEFIKATRLHKAKELLRSTELRVSEVADLVGFKNPAHFSRAYKQMFGENPKHR